MEIKPVLKTELELLKNLSEQTFKDTYEHLNDPVQFQLYLQKAFNPQQLEKEWSHPNSDFYFGWKDYHCLGYFKLNFEKADGDLLPQESVELERIYLSKENQGQGWGKALIQGALSKARRKAAYKWLWLGVWEKNEKAIAFYKRNGFEIYGEHFFMVGEDAQRDWLMKRAL